VKALLLALLLALQVLGMASAQPFEAPQLRVNGSAHHAAVRALAQDASGRWWLSAGDDKTARLWLDGQVQRVLRPPIGAGNEGKLYAAALSPDAQVAALAGWNEDNAVYLFRCADGSLIARIAGLPDAVGRLAFSPDGRQLAVLLLGRHGLQLWASSDGWRTPAFTGADADFAAAGLGLAISVDGQQLAASSADGGVRLYALRGGAPWRVAQQRLEAPAAGLQFSPDGRWLAAGLAERPEVRLLRADTLAPEATLRRPAPSGQPGGLGAVAWSADGRELAAAGSWRLAPGRHALLRWSLPQRQPLGEPQVLASDTITALLAGPNGWVHAAADAGVGHAPMNATARTDFRAFAGELRVSANGHQVQAPGWPQAFDLSAFGWRDRNSLAATPAQAAGLRFENWRDSTAPRLNGKSVPLEAGEVALAAAVHPPLQRAWLASAWMLRGLDAQGRELWRQPLEAPCFALAVSGDGRWLLAGLADGSLRWLHAADGEQRLALYTEGRAWVAWTPEGRYTAGEGGEQLVGWHVNRGADRAAEFLPLARLAEPHFDPAAVLGALQGQAPQRVASDPRQGLRPPPSVTLSGPSDRVEQPRVTLTLRAQDRGGGLDELRLFLNGKLVQAQPARGLRRLGSEWVGSWQGLLEPGENLLRAVAFSTDRMESEPAELRVHLAQAPKAAALHGLVVGINRYRNGALNLNYSVPDARGMAGLMREAGPRLFSHVQVTELTDAQATKAGILAQLRALQGSREEDVVAVYLAGHGEALGDTWYFIPHELTQPEQPEQLRAGGLSARELAAALKDIPARKVVVFIDACKSGAATAGFAARGLEERRVLAQLARASGTHLIAASTKEQLASELDALGHGAFTYVVLEGLKGKAAGGGKDITARKLMAYVEQALPEISKRFRAEEQFPVVNSTGMDFPLAVVPVAK
jgi:WD40 repeat protein